MSKATIQDIVDEGFRPDQFGYGTNATTGWSDAGGYLDRALTQAGTWAADRIGAAAYAALVPDSYAEQCTIRAEVCFCRARLFQRRVAFLDSSAVVGMGEFNTQHANRREMLAHAKEAWECAECAIADAIRATGGDPAAMLGSGASFGHIETGAWPSLETA